MRAINNLLRPFIIALQLLTRLPTPRIKDVYDSEVGYSIVYYPWVGLLIGIILVVVMKLLEEIFSADIIAVLLLVIWVLTTGGLHIDGLADSADAWIGGYGDREKTLAIMKQPTSGPIAVAAVVLVLLAKYIALTELIATASVLAIAIVPLVARAAAVLLFLTTDYIRRGGIGEKTKYHLPVGAAYLQCVVTLALVLFLAGGKGITLIVAVLITWFYLRWSMQRRLGGMTGDTTGALIEIIEVVSLVVLTLK